MFTNKVCHVLCNYRCGVPDRTASLKSNITLVSLPELRSAEDDIVIATTTTTETKNTTETDQDNTSDDEYQSSGDEEEGETISRRRRSLEIRDDQISARFDDGREESEVEEIMDDFETLYNIPEAEPTEESR